MRIESVRKPPQTDLQKLVHKALADLAKRASPVAVFGGWIPAELVAEQLAVSTTCAREHLNTLCNLGLCEIKRFNGAPPRHAYRPVDSGR